MLDPTAGPVPGDAPVDDAAADAPVPLVCAGCTHPITSATERIAVDGEHESVRMNLAGMLFRVGTFTHAPGCRAEGERSAQWTWFAGHAWQVVVCGRCGDHLGWVYSGPSRFFGLLLDHLIEVG